VQSNLYVTRARPDAGKSRCFRYTVRVVRIASGIVHGLDGHVPIPDDVRCRRNPALEIVGKRFRIIIRRTEYGVRQGGRGKTEITGDRVK